MRSMKLVLPLLGVLFGVVHAIYQGQKVSDSHYPYIVSLKIRNSSHIEGATIITRRHVLAYAWTVAAHRPTTLEAGTTRLGEGQIYKIVNSVVHPEFDRMTLTSPFAILTVDRDFEFGETIKPVRVLGERPGRYTPVVALGWGTNEEYARSDEATLRAATFYTLPKDECLAELKKVGNERVFNLYKMCAVPVEGHSRWCWYDLGGPVVASDLLVGMMIHNFGQMDCIKRPTAANLAIRVSDYVDWIKSNIGDEQLL